MSKKRILLINNGYPSSKFPNRSTYIKTIYECLSSEGLEVDRVALIDDFTGVTSKIIRYFNFYIKLLFFKVKAGDILYIHHIPFCIIPFLVRKLSSSEIVVNWHGEDLMSKSPIVKWLRNIAIRKVSKSCKVHIVPSFYFKVELEKRLGISASNIQVIPSGGVDTSIFRPIEKGKESREVVTIGFASGLDDGKGALILEKLIDLTLTTKDPIRYKIISFGSHFRRFKNKYLDNKEVEFIEKLRKDEMNKFYNNIDILFFPTKREAESLGLVSLEAMCCNVPVLGPNRFELQKIIKPCENGEFYYEENVEHVHSVLLTMIKRLRDYLPRDSIIANYSKEKAGNLYKNVFSNL